MLTDLRRELPEGCISDLSFDQWRAGELEPDQIEQFEQHLEGCARCQKRHDEIQAQAEEFLGKFPELELPEKAAKKSSNVVPLRPRKGRFVAWASGAASIVAAAAVLMLLGPWDDAATTDPAFGTRSKGSASIGFFVKHGDKVRVGSAGQVVHPGDQLRFTLTSQLPQHVAILSVDGAGVASIYYPKGAHSRPVGKVSRQPVDSSVLLDATLGEEKLWGVFCKAPFDLEPLRLSLEQHQQLPPLPDCSVDEFAIVKEPEP